MRAVLIAVLVAGCGRIGFDAAVTGDGGLPDADVARCGSQSQPLPLVANAQMAITACRGDTWFSFDAPPAHTITAQATVPEPAALAFELVGRDGVPYGAPVWTATTIAATGYSTQPAGQLLHITADAERTLVVAITVSVGSGNVYYIAPDGDNAGTGSGNAPWQTWPFALRQLHPGDTLIVLDGTWTDRDSCDGLPQPCLKVAPIAQTGDGYLQDAELFDADCFAGVNSGSPSQPITVVAEHQRRALSASSGRNYAYRIAGCTNWILDGLRGEGADAIAKADDPPGRVQKHVFIVDQSPNFVGRHLLGERPNRCANDWTFGIGGSPGTIIEDSEAYEFSRHGFFAADAAGAGVTFRRVYANGRDYPDVECSMTDQYPGPDDGVVCYHYLGQAPACTAENAIAEHVGAGFYDAGAASWSVRGSVALDTSVGFESRKGDQGDQPADARLFDDIVSLRSSVGIRNVGNALIVSRATLVGASGTAGDQGTAAKTYAGSPKANATTFTNVLALDSTRVGIDIEQPGSVVQYSSVANAGGAPPFAPVDPDITDGAGLVQHSRLVRPTRVGPAADQCLVYVPADDTLATAGVSGSAIGASIVHRVEQGTTTSDLLWNQRTGAFPCGAIIPGVNDLPGTSCFDVHERLHVGTPGCPIPN